MTNNTCTLQDKNAAFQDQINQIANEMDRRINSFNGVGVAVRKVIDKTPSSWFAGLFKWINGNTALHEAVAKQDLDAVKSLTHDDLNQSNRWGKSPIHLAAESNWSMGVDVLFKAGAQVPKSFAHLKLSREVLSCFLEAELDTQSASILLMSAVNSNQTDFAESFLRQGADMFQVFDGYLSSFEIALRRDPDSTLVEVFLNHFIKMHAKPKQKSFIGPFPKNPFTIQFELIIRHLIESAQNVSTVIKMNSFGQLFNNIIIENTEYDMFKIISQMNWEHLRLDDKDLENFERSPFYISPTDLVNDYFEGISHETLELRPHDQNCLEGCYYPEKYADLNVFDKGIIFSYTTMSPFVNSFLKGDLRDFHHRTYLQSRTHDPLFWWTYSAFLANALNKIPAETINHFACRGQLNSDRVNRINAVTFVSTSTLMSICRKYVEENGEFVIFDGIDGRDVTALSVLPNQREYVTLPARIELEASVLTETVLLFSGKLKNPDYPQPSIVLENEDRQQPTPTKLKA